MQQKNTFLHIVIAKMIHLALYPIIKMNREKLKKNYLRYLFREINAIVNNNIVLPYNLLILLLQSSNMLHKENLLANQLDRLTQQQAIECFKTLQMN